MAHANETIEMLLDLKIPFSTSFIFLNVNFDNRHCLHYCVHPVFVNDFDEGGERFFFWLDWYNWVWFVHIWFCCFYVWVSLTGSMVPVEADSTFS